MKKKIVNKSPVQQLREFSQSMQAERPRIEKSILEGFAEFRKQVKDSGMSVDKLHAILELDPLMPVQLICQKLEIPYNLSDKGKKELANIVRALTPFYFEVASLIESVVTDAEAAEMVATLASNVIGRVAATVNDVSNIVERVGVKHDFTGRGERINAKMKALNAPKSRTKLRKSVKVVAKEFGVTPQMMKSMKKDPNVAKAMLETFMKDIFTKAAKRKTKKAKKASPEVLARREADPLWSEYHRAKDAARKAGVNVSPRARRKVNGKRPAHKLDKHYLKGVISKARAKGLQF